MENYDIESKIATIKQKNRVFPNDLVEILRPFSKEFNIELNDMRDEKGVSIDVANRAEMIFKIHSDIELKPNDMLIKEKQ